MTNLRYIPINIAPTIAETGENFLPWIPANEYKPYTIVRSSAGAFYISIKAVPVNIQLSDTTYWLPFGNGTTYTLLKSGNTITLTGTDGSTSSVTDTDTTTFDATAITSGTFATARIPNLAASKITSGTFATARIPNLAASKITSGTFDEERIPSLSTNKLRGETFGTLWCANLDGNFTYGVLPVYYGGTGSAGLTAVSSDDWITAASGWEINTCNVRTWGKLCAVYLQIHPTSAQTAGNKTLGTVGDSYKPPIVQGLPSMSTSSSAIYIDSAGTVKANVAALNASQNLWYTGLYMLA